MFRKMIAGASALAIGALVATGALATHSSSGGDTFNGTTVGVSIQFLTAVSVGPAIDIDVVPIVSGNATIMDNVQQQAVGIVQASANTGTSAIIQQASSIGVGANINF